MNKSASLPFSEQLSVLTEIAQLADQSTRYSQALVDAQFQSFLARQEWGASFCACHELETHAQKTIAYIKARIATPDGLLRGANGQDKWVETDPCRLRANEMMQNARDEYTARLDAFLQTYRVLRDEEFLHHGQMDEAGLLAQDIAVRGYAAFYGEKLVQAFAPFGFVYDALRSKPLLPVVSKPVTAQWDLCWSPESVRTLRWPPPSRPKTPRVGSDPDLVFYARARGRHGPSKRSINFSHSDVMLIRIGALVLDFDWAYSRFYGVEDLATVFAAYGYLYSLVGGAIEKILAGSLP